MRAGNMEQGFSPWRKWNDRDEPTEQMKCPGIYIVALSESKLSGKPFSLSKSIVYVGMTNAKLEKRLAAFDTTIRKKRLEHGGADRFLGTHQEFKDVEARLYVSTKHWEWPSTDKKAAECLRTMGIVAAAEYEMLARCVEELPGLPVFNQKESKKFGGWPKKGG